MVKWKLMFTTLPIVLLLVAFKLTLEIAAHFSGFIKFSDIAIIITGGIFLIGFMLAGTMTDYKESERIPAEMACSLEAIEEGLCHIAEAKQNIDVREARKIVAELAATIHDWLYKKTPSAKVSAVISIISSKTQTLDATAIAVRVQNELHTLRKYVTRVEVISRTSFIESGYALLDTVTALVITLVLISKFETTMSEAIVTGFVSLIYIYMIRLIRDIDDPFEYEEGKPKGAAEVDLFPLEEYQQRLCSRT